MRRDGAGDVVDRVLVEQAQHAGIVLAAARRAVLLFQGGSQFAEERRQRPAAHDLGVVERRGALLKRAEVMVGIEDLLVAAVASRVRGDHLVAEHDIDAIDVRLHRDGLKCSRARHAVAVRLEAGRLILVDFRRLEHARIEGAIGQ
jgi:hypothetical protein